MRSRLGSISLSLLLVACGSPTESEDAEGRSSTSGSSTSGGGSAAATSVDTPGSSVATGSTSGGSSGNATSGTTTSGTTSAMTSGGGSSSMAAPSSNAPASSGPAVEGIDAAEVVTATFPTDVACGAAFTSMLTMRNTGTRDWNRGTERLGANGDNDPFYRADTRVDIPSGVVVRPGMEFTFNIAMVAPSTEGALMTDWRMVREGYAWFGPTVERTITVTCPPANRTPDPAPGQRLPLPYEYAVVQGVAAAHPEMLAASCQDEPGGSWAFLDLVVDELRQRDTRWGYNWKRGNIGDPSKDVVDYHYGAGPDESSTEVYIIDVVGGHCGPNPQPAWIDVTEATVSGGTIGRWTGRGRF